MTDTLRRANREDIRTTLRRTARVGDATIYVYSTSGYSDAPGRIRIEGEKIWYFGRTAEEFTGCVRGADLNQGGSSEQEHLGGTQVFQDNPDDTDLSVGGITLAASSNLSFENGPGITWAIDPDLVSNSAQITPAITFFTPEAPTQGAAIVLKEGTNNGVNDISIVAPAVLAADYVQTLPAANGTVALVPTLTSRSVTGAVIATANSQTLNVSCLAGEVAIAGEYVAVSFGILRVFNFYRSAAGTWTMSWYNDAGANNSMTLRVLCAKFGA